MRPFLLLFLLWRLTSVASFSYMPATTVQRYCETGSLVDAGFRHISATRTILYVAEKGHHHVATFKNLDDVLETYHEETVLVCFYTANCGPCRLMKKELEGLQRLLSQENDLPPLRIFRLDTERYPALGVRFNIHRLPSLLFVKDREVQLKLEGVNTAEVIAERVKDLRSAT